MSEVLTASQVEAAAAAGCSELAVAEGTIVTPLARDRADALGLALPGATPSTAPPQGRLNDEGGGGPRRSGWVELDVARLALESRIRILARRQLLRRGRGVGDMEEVVSAVMAELFGKGRPAGSCSCEKTS